MKRLLPLLALIAACQDPGPGPTPVHDPVSASSLALDRGGMLWVANPEADSVSLIDTAARALVAEIALAPSPVRDAAGRFDPAVRPRSVAVDRMARKVYVAGESANRVYVIDADTRTVTSSIAVDAAPVSLLVSQDGERVYVVCHEGGTVVAIDTRTATVSARLTVGEHPWGASISGGDARWLYVSHFLVEPGISVIDRETFTVRNVVPLAVEPPKAAGKQVPNGEPRGLYGVVPRPGNGELWVPHLLLATQTAQPELDFESTVFPTVSTLNAGATAEGKRLLFQPLAPAGQKGSFIDSVSGPRAIAFTADGKLALVLMGQSEDVMVFDAAAGFEVQLVRPLPSAFLEGIVVDGDRAYVDGRNTHDVTVLKIDASNAGAPVKVDGAPIERLVRDPMPAELRLGQRLFYSANSAAFPITRNFWVACSSCHLEGGTDAVTWRFESGPRDTPSNAGGMLGTGFMFRQGLRNTVAQYDETINVEQGGLYHRTDPQQRIELDALAAFVNSAIPLPQNPHRRGDGTLSEEQARGKQHFDAACASCHSGPWLTDSGAGNPTLDLAGPIALHDVGTCVVGGAFPDKPRPDAEGIKMHTACDFDTPTLRGIFATPPYFHDGSARTLRDVVDRLSFSSGLSESAKADLVAYLLTL
jgi:YVTN family beta-propeller protein